MNTKDFPSTWMLEISPKSIVVSPSICCSESRKINQTAVMAFDQPLSLKALGIVELTAVCFYICV